MSSKLSINFYNTLSKKKEEFKPLDPKHIKMYVCGPTVYDYIHIGNARPIVVFDTLFRLLKHKYKNVTYVRNITDIDDKIITKALNNQESIQSLTTRTTSAFHEDISKLNVLTPTFEPKATDNISEMIAIIENLIKKNHAYIENNNVLFSIDSFASYGDLSGLSQEDLIQGARIEIDYNKKNPSDFILWKSVEKNEIGWNSPWGYGRPGWHIECSAMVYKYLGENFDIHGGGIDLTFPHHENERAQSMCCFSNSKFSNYWLHNGFLMAEGHKMSKSLGNFITLNEALKENHGEIIRLTLLRTHYRQPIDFKHDSLEQSKNILNSFYSILSNYNYDIKEIKGKPSNDFLEALGDDLNTPKALQVLHENIMYLKKQNDSNILVSTLEEASMLGLLQQDSSVWFGVRVSNLSKSEIESLIIQRAEAKKAKDFTKADNIRKYLQDNNIEIQDNIAGTTTWIIK